MEVQDFMGQPYSALGLLAIVASVAGRQVSAFGGKNDSCGIDGGQTCTSKNHTGRVQTFKRWLKGCGADFRRARIKTFRKVGKVERGLAAAKDLQKLEEVMSIPVDCILTADHSTILGSPFAMVTNASFTEEDGSESWVGHAARIHAFLAAELRRLRDGNASNAWGPMLRMLPSPEEYREFLPLYASSSLLEKFAALPLVIILRLQIKAHTQMWERHGEEWAELAKEHGAKGLNFEDYTWAKAILQTRAHQAPWSSANIALVPLSDLSNMGGITGTPSPPDRKSVV